MKTVIPCPECGVAAEIEDRFFLPSTEGPIEHIVVHCAAGHHFRMSADRLPARQPRQVTAQPAAQPAA